MSPTAAVTGSLRILNESRTATATQLAKDGFTLLAETEPELGHKKILSANPPEILLLPGRDGDFERAVETACRLAVMLYVWQRGGLLLHATGIYRADASEGGHPTGALVALALSGGGKSTLTSLADGFYSLSDETVALLPRPPSEHPHSPWMACGTIFRSSSFKPPAPTVQLPLRALLLLEKSPSHELIPATPLHTLQKLLRQTYSEPSIEGFSPEVFRRAAQLAREVPAYRFRFPKDARAVRELLENLMPGNSMRPTYPPICQDDKR